MAEKGITVEVYKLNTAFSTLARIFFIFSALTAYALFNLIVAFFNRRATINYFFTRDTLFTLFCIAIFAHCLFTTTALIFYLIGGKLNNFDDAMHKILWIVSIFGIVVIGPVYLVCYAIYKNADKRPRNLKKLKPLGSGQLENMGHICYLNLNDEKIKLRSYGSFLGEAVDINSKKYLLKTKSVLFSQPE